MRYRHRFARPHSSSRRLSSALHRCQQQRPRPETPSATVRCHIHSCAACNYNGRAIPRSCNRNRVRHVANLTSLLVPNAVTKRVPRLLAKPRHDVGQILERALIGDQRVEPRVPQQVQRQRHASSVGPPRCLQRAQPTHLATLDCQPPGVERLAQRQRDAGPRTP